MNRHEIRSRLDGRLLHVVLRGNDIEHGRADVSAPREALQLSAIGAAKWTRYNRHRHIPKAAPAEHITQETWIVVRGRVAVDHYDLDGALIGSSTLEAGDCTITYEGGHGYLIMADDTRVYEVKSGPYGGKEKDKVVF